MFRLGVVAHPETLTVVEQLAADWFTDVRVLPVPFATDAALAEAVASVAELQGRCDGILYSRRAPYLLVAGQLRHTVPVRYVGIDSSHLLLSLLKAHVRYGFIPADVSIDSFDAAAATTALESAGLGPERLRVRTVTVPHPEEGLVNATLEQHLRNHAAGSELCLTDIMEVRNSLFNRGIPVGLTAPPPESFVHEIRNLQLRHRLRTGSRRGLAFLRLRLSYRDRYRWHGSLPLREVDDLARAERLLAVFAQDVDGSLLQLGRFEYALVCREELLEGATAGYSDFGVLGSLRRETAFAAALGIGCGTGVRQAEANAQAALNRVAGLSGTHALVITGDGTVLGPLKPHGKRQPQESGREVNLNRIALDTGLGLHVLNRLSEMLRARNTSLTTSTRLAEHLHVSSRTAIRILGRLLEHGYASVEGRDLTRTKGRPARLIRLHF